MNVWPIAADQLLLCKLDLKVKFA